MTISVNSSSASELAKTSLIESTPANVVGDALDVANLESHDAAVTLASHTFACTDAAYPGWYWDVTVVGIEGQDYLTVSEINLLPGDAALVPDSWKPWADRVEPGDLTPGDLLPASPDDARLTAGLTGIDELIEVDLPLLPEQWEIGLGREKVLSGYGLDRAVDRWMGGDTGPRSQMAKLAPAQCSSCGFLLAVGGTVGQAFGVCANELGAADGQLVAMTFGCGAHSSVKAPERAPVPVVPLVIDDVSDEESDASALPDYVADAEPVVDDIEDAIEDANEGDRISTDEQDADDVVDEADADDSEDDSDDDSDDDIERDAEHVFDALESLDVDATDIASYELGDDAEEEN